MEITRFINLIRMGFDVSFNYEDVFYTISLIAEDDNRKKYGIGADNGFAADFDSIDSIPNFVLAGKRIEDIIKDLSDEEIFY